MTRAVSGFSRLASHLVNARAVKPMLAQGSGSIINVTSGAHMGAPTMGVYGATKGAVASMLENDATKKTIFFDLFTQCLSVPAVFGPLSDHRTSRDLTEFKRRP